MLKGIVTPNINQRSSREDFQRATRHFSQVRDNMEPIPLPGPELDTWPRVIEGHGGRPHVEFDRDERERCKHDEIFDTPAFDLGIHPRCHCEQGKNAAGRVVLRFD